MPKIEYVPKSFSTDRLRMIERVNSVVAEYERQGYSLTLRQVYYQMVARDIIPNNMRSYKNLGNLINDARLAGLIDWLAIEDRTRNLRGNAHWEKPGEVIESAAYSYKLDHWAGQENYVEVWVEKDALIGIVGKICKQLDVNHFSCRGYVSQSEMWAAARRLRSRQLAGQHVVLLHLGDHDPSGKDMSRDIQERLVTFETYDVTFKRLALNMDQVELYNPPPNPAKLTDSRSTGYIERYGNECWELDALEPKVISDVISENVTMYRDDALYRAVVQREREEKRQLDEFATYYDGVLENWEEIKDNYIYP